MRKLKILYVITKLELGGAQKQLLSLISNLDKESFEVFLFTARRGLLLEDALSISGLTLKKSRFLERAINPFKDLVALIEIHRFIKENNIDIVHTHSSKAGILGRLAARLAKVKIILHTVHGWSFNDYQPFFLRRIFVWLERKIASFTHRIIVVSESDKQNGLNNRIGEEDKYILIRYGIDYSEFLKSVQPHAVRQGLGIENGDFLVTTVSCFKPQKSPQDFVRLAFSVSKKVPNVKFLLIGDGALRRRIERLRDKFSLQNKIILSGWRRDIPQILSVSDIFILTSLWEGLPVSVLEAMAASCPVVATNTGGISEVVIDGKTGFLVSCRDIDNMSCKVVALLRDKDLRKEIAFNARRNFEFRLEDSVRNTQNLYGSLIKN